MSAPYDVLSGEPLHSRKFGGAQGLREFLQSGHVDGKFLYRGQVRRYTHRYEIISPGRSAAIEALYPMLALIHVFLDNASYHHAKLVQEWLSRAGCRIELHFIPPYCPHLNPIERLWGLMHRNVTHNKCYATCAQFADATLSFLREKVPRNWADLCDSVTDNFRVINPKDFRVMT